MPFVNFPVMCELCRYQLMMEGGKGEPRYLHAHTTDVAQLFGWDWCEKCPNWGKRYRIVNRAVEVEEI